MDKSKIMKGVSNGPKGTAAQRATKTGGKTSRKNPATSKVKK